MSKPYQAQIPIFHQDFNYFAFVLSPKGKRVIGIIKRSIQHIRMPSVGIHIKLGSIL